MIKLSSTNEIYLKDLPRHNFVIIMVSNMTRYLIKINFRDCKDFKSHDSHSAQPRESLTEFGAHNQCLLEVYA